MKGQEGLLFDSGYVCPVCGFPATPTPPVRLDLPFWWSTSRCPACGYDYGKGYGRIGVGAGPFSAWRNGWTANGRSWQGEEIGDPAPDWWDAEGHLARLYDDVPCAPVLLGPEEAVAVRRHLGAEAAALLDDLPHGIARRKLTALIDALADVALDRTTMASFEVDEQRLVDKALRMLVRTQEIIGRQDAARAADALPSGEVR